eukprot:m.138953 g.138953  ORF g.138953 m.138953 type:complete len:64 (+) comp14786_c1_seq2:375-566(+)
MLDVYKFTVPVVTTTVVNVVMTLGLSTAASAQRQNVENVEKQDVMDGAKKSLDTSLEIIHADM